MMEQDATTNMSMLYGGGGELSPPPKKPKLELGGVAPHEATLWPCAGRNKPVGIAQPFLKMESLDSGLGLGLGPLGEDSCRKDPPPCRKDDQTDLKAGLSCDKPEADKEAFASDDGKGSSSKATSGLSTKCERLIGESGSGSDTTSSFDYAFEAPSDLAETSDEDEKVRLRECAAAAATAATVVVGKVGGATRGERCREESVEVTHRMVGKGANSQKGAVCCL